MKSIYILVTAFFVLAFASCSGKGAASGEECLARSRDSWQEGNLFDAYKYAQLAQLDFERDGLPEGSAVAKIKITLFLYMSGLYEEAYTTVRSITPAEAELLQADDKDNHALLLAYLSAYCDGDTETSMAYCDSLCAQHMRTEPENRALYYLDLNNIVEIKTLLGDTATAWTMIRAMEAEPVVPDNEFYRHQMNVNKTRLYLLAGQYDSAAAYGREVLAGNFNPKYDSHNVALAYRALMKADSLAGNWPEYLEHRSRHDYLYYEVLGNTARYRIAVAQGAYEAERQARDTARHNNRIYFGILVLAFVLVLVCIVAVWKIRESGIKRRLALLECERLDIEAFRSKLRCDLLDRKVENQAKTIEQILDDNLSLRRELTEGADVKDPKRRLDRLSAVLKEQHAPFFEKLDRLYPGLNTNDRLLLGLIYMKLPSKEISEVLSITPESLMKARYRLRKKMGLSPDDNLNDIVFSM